MRFRDRALKCLSGEGSHSSTRLVIAFLVVFIFVAGGSNTFDVLDQNVFHEEVRNLYHFDPGRTNSKDYVGRFLKEFPQPFLYSALTRSALYFGIDLILFHKLLALMCGFLFLIGGAVAGSRMGGAVAAFSISALLVAQPIYQYQINSATPHAFAFPLLMWGIVCLLYARPDLLAGLTVLSGLLYPPISPILGLSLLWNIVVVRKGLTSQNPNRVADVLILVVVGAISLALLWHQIMPIQGYGMQLLPGVNVDIYPENGPSGRHFYGVFSPLAYVFVSTFGQFRQILLPEVILVVMFLFAGVAIYGLYRLRERASVFAALLSFVGPSLILCVSVIFLRPSIAYRFVMYPLFVVLPLLFVSGLLILSDGYREKLRYPTVTFAAAMLVVLATLNSFDTARNGLNLRLDEPSRQLMNFVRDLPAKSLLAYWPKDPQLGLIPYVAGRPSLVSYKAHYPTYEGHIANMRARLFDLIDAYLASDARPLIQLHCRWQVDYIIANREHFTRAETAPKYFAPFNQRVQEILHTTDTSKMILRHPPSDIIVLRAGKFVVVDLAALAKGGTCPQ